MRIQKKRNVSGFLGLRLFEIVPIYTIINISIVQTQNFASQQNDEALNEVKRRRHSNGR